MPALTGLEITFRCLHDVAMDFRSPEDGSPSPFIALVGPNGAGKTTVLESVALSVCWLFRPDLMIPLRPEDVVRLHFQGETLGFMSGGLLTGISGDLRSRLSRTLSIRSGYLPVIPRGQALSTGIKGPLEPLLALGLQEPGRRDDRIAAVHQWWLHQHLEYPEAATLHRLWRALEPFLGDLVYAGVNPQDHLPLFDARGTQVGFNELSSGERRIILLFLEIAMQCGEDGLVLFDEPEAHFHPKWQQMLPDALAQLLPRGQVIVATHAPHIVEGLPAHQLFVLGDLPW